MSEELSDRDLASDLYRDARLMDECGYLHIGTVMRRAAKRLENHHIPRAQYEAYVMAAAREATIAWACCASLHREYAKGKDPFYTTRQADFVKHEETARVALRAAGCLEDGR